MDTTTTTIAGIVGVALFIALLYFVFWKKEEKFDGAPGDDPRLAWMRR